MSAERRRFYLLHATMFQVMLGFGVIIPTLPFFARFLGASSLQMGLLVTLWAGAQFVAAPFWGGLSDRLGRRPVLLIGLFGYCLSFAALALSASLPELFLARVSGGLLTAATIPTVQAYVADVLPRERRGSAMASVGAAQNVGFIAGPAVGGLIAPLGVHAVFWIGAALALLNAVAATLLLPESPVVLARRAAGATLPAGVAGEADVRRDLPRGRSGPQAIAFALRGPYASLFLLAFVATFGGSTMFSMLAYYLMDRIGGGQGMTGLAFTVEGVTAALVQILIVPPLIRTTGEESAVRWSLVSGFLGFGGLTLAATFPAVLASLALISAAISTLRPTIAALLSQRTQLEQGITMGIQQSFDALGRTVGPMWAGFTYSFGPEVPFYFAAGAYAISFLGMLSSARRAARLTSRAGSAPRDV